MAKTVTFLQLSQEFGGTRFGPFQGVEVRLGSDPSRNDITLPEALGVASEHVKILKQQDGSFILAPIDRTAAVYYWRAGSSKPKQITTPMAVQSGDGFSLVTAEGPRFYIMVEIDRAAIEAAAKESQGPGMSMPNVNAKAGGVVREIKRVGMAKFFTTKIGHYAQNGWRFVSTGQMFSPVYIVLGMTMFSGWLFAGGAACTALSFNSTKGQYQEQLTNCRDQLGVVDGEDGDPTVPGLTKKILIDRTWTSTIENDQDLYKAYAENLKVIFSDPSRYEWVYSKKGSDFDKFKSALEKTGMPENLARVVAYASARPGVSRDWDVVVDSEDAEVCGRGPLALTYAQAWRLGVTNVQMDAFVDRATASSNDLEKHAEVLRKTASRIDAPTELDQDLIRTAGAQLQGGGECLYVEGTDDRTDPVELANAIQRKLGASVTAGLPRESEQYWIASRLVKLYTLDFTRPLPDELKFDAKQAPSTTMTLEQVKASRKTFAINQAAAIIARAVAIPCLATLDKETRRAPPSFMWELPNLGSCAIVKAFVEYDQI